MLLNSVNDLFTDAVYYRQYRRTENLSYFDNIVSPELRRMKRKIVMHMTDRPFGRSDSVAVIAFLQNVKAAADSRNI